MCHYLSVSVLVISAVGIIRSTWNHNDFIDECMHESHSLTRLTQNHLRLYKLAGDIIAR